MQFLSKVPLLKTHHLEHAMNASGAQEFFGGARRGTVALLTALVALTACKGASDGSDGSQLRIVNGKTLTASDMQLGNTVFQVSVLDAALQSEERSCTAVAISERVVILAAHCVPKEAGAEARLKIVGKSAPVKRIIAPQSLRGVDTLSEDNAAADVAALELASAGSVFATSEIALLANISAGQGTRVKMIGFGATELSALKTPGAATSQASAAIGSQKIISASGATYEVRATEQDLKQPQSGVSIAAPGDSGGPVFDADGKLIGLLVGLSFYSIGNQIALTEDANLVAGQIAKADAFGNKILDLRNSHAQKVMNIALGRESGEITYIASANPLPTYLAICSHKGAKTSEAGEDRLGTLRNGKDLKDILGRLRDKNGSSGSSSGSGSSGSSNDTPLTRGEIKDILNSL